MSNLFVVRDYLGRQTVITVTVEQTNDLYQRVKAFNSQLAENAGNSLAAGKESLIQLFENNSLNLYPPYGACCVNVFMQKLCELSLEEDELLARIRRLFEHDNLVVIEIIRSLTDAFLMIKAFGLDRVRLERVDPLGVKARTLTLSTAKRRTIVNRFWNVGEADQPTGAQLSPVNRGRENMLEFFQRAELTRVRLKKEDIDLFLGRCTRSEEARKDRDPSLIVWYLGFSHLINLEGVERIELSVKGNAVYSILARDVLGKEKKMVFRPTTLSEDRFNEIAALLIGLPQPSVEDRKVPMVRDAERGRGQLIRLFEHPSMRLRRSVDIIPSCISAFLKGCAHKLLAKQSETRLIYTFFLELQLYVEDESIDTIVVRQKEMNESF
jgi:hypothetical protein